MKVNMIFARSVNGVIGKDNKLPWNLPEDMAHFKRITENQIVIMGRKTWDSLPEKFRPLPNRVNVIISSKGDTITTHGAKVVSGIKEALAYCKEIVEVSNQEVWVIGGSSIYALAEPYASRIEVTEIDEYFEGDAVAPILHSCWLYALKENNISKTGVKYRFITYELSLPSAV